MHTWVFYLPLFTYYGAITLIFSYICLNSRFSNRYIVVYNESRAVGPHHPSPFPILPSNFIKDLSGCRKINDFPYFPLKLNDFPPRLHSNYIFTPTYTNRKHTKKISQRHTHQQTWTHHWVKIQLLKSTAARGAAGF